MRIFSMRFSLRRTESTDLSVQLSGRALIVTGATPALRVLAFADAMPRGMRQVML